MWPRRSPDATGCLVRARAGTALLLALVVLVLCALTALALVRGRAADARVLRLGHARADLDRVLDSVAAVAVTTVRADGAWRGQPPGTVRTGPGTSAGSWSVTRLTWRQLLLTVAARSRSGVPRLVASLERRVVLPLVLPPLGNPSVLLETDAPGAPAGMLVIPAPDAIERACRAGASPNAEGAATWRLDSVPGIRSLDPDTVRGDTIIGAVRLTRQPVRPMAVRGVLVADSALRLRADLHINGLLVAAGPLVPEGGLLSVTGGVRLRGAAAALTALGAGHRFTYDACAIRQALDVLGSVQAPARWSRIPAG